MTSTRHTQSHVNRLCLLGMMNSKCNEGCSRLVSLNDPWGEKPLTNEQKTRANICGSHFAYSFYSSASLSVPSLHHSTVSPPFAIVVNRHPKEMGDWQECSITSTCTRMHINTHIQQIRDKPCRKTHSHTHTHTEDWQASPRQSNDFLSECLIGSWWVPFFSKHVLSNYEAMTKSGQKCFCPQKDLESASLLRFVILT